MSAEGDGYPHGVASTLPLPLQEEGREGGAISPKQRVSGTPGLLCSS